MSPQHLERLNSTFLSSNRLQQGITVVKLTSGTNAQGRGRRQLPQTPLTPRPAVAYKTPTSSAPPPSATASTTGPQARFGRGISEHDRLLPGHEESKIPVTSIGLDSNSNRQQLDFSQPVLLEEGEDFQDAVSSHGGGHPSRSAAPTSASQGTAATPGTAASTQGRAAGVPNGYHFTLGSASGPGSRGTAGLGEREEEDWC
ncbi:hypothetical protein CHARACLAT_017054 [Characodon lateralis]|uniref:Uncharacterized protein n=1 Tax=Characodon lateralis TaxID=208331 RepID=A0ABU7DJG1_9TELE|nr:hypothetical protein [Characodon lateralis]